MALSGDQDIWTINPETRWVWTLTLHGALIVKRLFLCPHAQETVKSALLMPMAQIL